MFKKKARQYKAVFRTRIDFNHDVPYGKSLVPGHDYCLEECSNARVSYSEIADEAVRIINNDLKTELQKYTDMPIEEVRVQAVYEGSTEIIYTVDLNILNHISGIKGLYDFVDLIRKISERHVNKELIDRFGKHFYVDTYVIMPENRCGKECIKHWHLADKAAKVPADEREIRRDAFFYYLLVANVVLLIIIGVLVFGAVKATYF